MSGKLGIILQFVTNRSVLCMALQETRLPGSRTFRVGDFLVVESGGEPQAKWGGGATALAGVGFLVHARLAAHILQVVPYSARLMLIQFKVRGGASLCHHCVRPGGK